MLEMSGDVNPSVVHAAG